MKKTLTTLSLLGTGVLFADGAAAGGQSMWQMVAMIGIAVAFFYFIVLRPERKRRRQAQEQRAMMQKGDLITAMGIKGTIVKVMDETVVVKLYDGAKMELLKAAINDVKRASDVAPAKDAKPELAETT